MFNDNLKVKPVLLIKNNHLFGNVRRVGFFLFIFLILVGWVGFYSSLAYKGALLVLGAARKKKANGAGSWLSKRSLKLDLICQGHV